MREDFEELEQENLQMNMEKGELIDEIERLKMEVSIQTGISQQLEAELGSVCEETQVIRAEAKLQKELDRAIDVQKEIAYLTRAEQKKSRRHACGLP